MLALSQLQQKVRSFLAQFSAQRDVFVVAQFAPHVFQSQPHEKLAFYLAQVEQTLSQIAQAQDEQALAFYSEKIIAQCTALNDAFQHAAPVKQNQAEAKPQPHQHAVHSLPPRERLVKYYEYLQEFNQRIEKIGDLLHLLEDSEQRMDYEQQMARLQQRRAKCLESIETLEEYLAFKDQQEEAVSIVQ